MGASSLRWTNKKVVINIMLARHKRRREKEREVMDVRLKH